MHHHSATSRRQRHVADRAHHDARPHCALAEVLVPLRQRSQSDQRAKACRAREAHG